MGPGLESGLRISGAGGVAQARAQSGLRAPGAGPRVGTL